MIFFGWKTHMAFQTNVLRGGEWVTETVDLQTVLKANATAKGPKKQRSKPPCAGILTRTVVESEAINSIVPVRLRSAHHQDVAFVGDHVVYIREFKKDGHLHDVIKLSEFGVGERIRHAGVIGCLSDEFESEHQEPAVKTEDDLVVPLGSFPPAETSSSDNNSTELPPQLLLLVLESGDCIFLFVRSGPGGLPEFVASRFRSPKERLVSPGFHLAVDPSSRYIALACATNFFVVYELEPFETLRERYRQNQPLNPIRACRPRGAHGVIHRIEFLYPRPGDDHHIILLVVVVRNRISRMVTYEWEVEEDLRSVLAQEKNGHRMPAEHELPLLLIPLKIRSAFIVVSEDQVAVCTESLHGPPNFEAFDVRAPIPVGASSAATERPLWTAWARPVRQKMWFRAQDCIYLAREDGVVMFIEADPDGPVTCSTLVDKLDCSIYSAFACLYAPYDDILLTAGDSGPGGIWQVRMITGGLAAAARRAHAFQASPREFPVSLGTIPNWAPTVDFVTTDECSTAWSQEVSAKGNRMASWQQHRQLKKPDRIFATSGKGDAGSVTEFRHGLRASISLELEYPGSARQAWVLPASLADPSRGFHILLSMPNHSAVVHLTGDYSEATLLDADVVPYDVTVRTLATARITSDLVMQISEQRIVILTPEKNVRLRLADILQGASSATISDASIRDHCIVISTHTNADFQIHVLRLDRFRISLTHERTIDIDGEVTCMTVTPDFFLLAGIWKSGQPLLARCSLLMPGDLEVVSVYDRLPRYSGPGEDFLRSMEAIVSIVSCQENLAVLGTRSGELITVTLFPTRMDMVADKLSLTAVTIARTRQSNSAQPTIFTCCDRNLMLLTSLNSRDGDRNAGHFNSKYRVWPVDAQALSAPSPPVDYAVVTDLASDNRDITPMLFLSGPRILLAELQHRPTSIHRSMPVEGTPMRVIYSHYLRCLIVAVNKVDDRPTLMFIDPDTGENLGRPTEKDGNPLDFISGLGRAGDRIYGLSEWDYKKEGKVWRFILVATKSGRLLVVSTEKVASELGGRQRIRYWTRMTKKHSQPIYSVLGLDDGIVFGVGDGLRWEILDTEEKKLKEFQVYELGSPATSLRRVNGKILILTHRDSLEIFDPPVRRGTISESESLVHVDPRIRHAMHMIDITGTQPADPLSSMVLVSDRDCGIGGLWVPWQSPGRDCEVVFEAELPASIVKFCRGRTRPIWGQERHALNYGRLPSTTDDAEILGLCLNGSVQHITLLNLEAWRLLRFIQNVAKTSGELYPFSYEPIADASFDPEPQVDRDLQMHVDGDMLRRCLDKRSLERLLSQPAHLSRFTELLDELDNGQHTSGFQSDRGTEQYFTLAYDMLEYLLAPAF